MGLATMAVLICTNFVISCIKKITPDMVRIPVFIVVIVCQRQLEFAVVLESQFVAQPGDGGLGRTAQPGQFC